MAEASRHSSMTAVQAYTTGCRNSPGDWGRDRTVLKSWKGHGAHPCDQGGRAVPRSSLRPATGWRHFLDRVEVHRSQQKWSAWGGGGPQSGEHPGRVACGLVGPPPVRSAAGASGGSDGQLPKGSPLNTRLLLLSNALYGGTTCPREACVRLPPSPLRASHPLQCCF